MSSSTPAQHEAYPFAPEQLARLAWYRAAVQAGFYTDAASSVPTAPADELSALPLALFTRSELSRLVAYRRAVAAGLCSELCDARRSA
jgi:hypothetical protein